MWQQREQIKEELQGIKKFDERPRRIFYDTDNIIETQKETVRICHDCGGTIRIDSSTDQGYHILGVHIPINACKDCRETGYQWYESADAKGFDMVFLQDRTEDKYLCRKFK